jgi:hypothetical protein
VTPGTVARGVQPCAAELTSVTAPAAPRR